MKVLATGAAGFIGRHVSSALSKTGHEVVGLDARMPEADGWGLQDFIQADITLPIPPIKGLDAVIHLAAIAAPRECDVDPVRAFAVNVNGTYQVLRMALASGAKKIVFASTAHIYDIPPKYLPTDESHPLRLNNTYTTTKLLGEQLCELFWENHGLSYTTLRLFNAYGPGQAAGYFIPDVLRNCKLGAINLKGGATTKDWVYIDDVARAFVAAIETPYVGPVNIGTGKETCLHDIAKQIALATNATYLAKDLDPNATRMCADNRRAKNVLGWEPTTDIWSGLDAILAEQAKVAV